MTDVSSLIITILPLAAAAAVSPVILSVFLVIMSISDNPRLSGLSFHLGAIVVLLVTVFIGIFLGHKLTGGVGHPTTIAAIDVFLGAVLILLGFLNFTSKKESILLKALPLTRKTMHFQFSSVSSALVYT